MRNVFVICAALLAWGCGVDCQDVEGRWRASFSGGGDGCPDFSDSDIYVDAEDADATCGLNFTFGAYEFTTTITATGRAEGSAAITPSGELVCTYPSVIMERIEER